MLGEMDGVEECHVSRTNEKCNRLEQFYSVLPGDLRYLVRDKKPQNLQEASETADSINELRNPRFSEVKIGGKVWDDRKRGSKDYLRSNQATGSHFKGKPSELSHQKHDSYEGKGDKPIKHVMGLCISDTVKACTFWV